MHRNFKFRLVNELTGLFVLGVAALAVAAVVFSGHSQGWFARKCVFDILLPAEGALGLRRGDEVFILGVSAGVVHAITVGDDGRMTASITARRDFERFVRVDSTASIKKVFGVAGDSFIEISRGTGAALPSHKPVIACLPSEDSLGRMEKMLVNLHSELMPAVRKAASGLDEWTQLGGELRTNGEQLRQFVARLDNLATGLEQGRGTAGKLLTDTTLTDEAGTLLRRANDTMSEVRSALTNLNAAVVNVRQGTARLPEFTDALANEARDLPGLVRQTQTSMRELERLIEALQRHWLVRKYMNQSPELPGPPLSKSQEAPPKRGKSFQSSHPSR